MALTVIFALAGSLVLSLTLMPVLASLGAAAEAAGEGGLADPLAQAALHARCSTRSSRHPLAGGAAGASA